MNLKIRKSKFFKNVFENNWLFTRFSWPRFLFVSNVLSCPSSVGEALNLGIYCLAIVDTNVRSNAINIAVPGNDESLYSIIFYNELVCNYILLCKFKSMILWFSNIRNYKKLNLLNNDFLSEKIKEQPYLLFLSPSKSFLNSLNVIFTSNMSFIDGTVQSTLYKAGFSHYFQNFKELLSRNFRLFFLISR